MRSPVSRTTRWVGALALAVIVALAVFGSGGSGAADTPPPSPEPIAQEIQTEFGPLSASDIDLLHKVRQAGLWEMPTGQQMQQRAVNDVVRTVGGRLAAEHAELDEMVREVADQLGVTLPSQPSNDQQRWMQEISAQSGPDYDRTAVNLLRQAHGKVLPVISQVRTGTRNGLVRQFATDAAQFVTRHCEYLESTGLVDFAALPQPPLPAASPAAASAAGDAASPSSPVLAANASTVNESSNSGETVSTILATIRNADMSAYTGAGLAFVAVVGLGALIDWMTRGRSTSAPSRTGQPAPRNVAVQPFPASPAPAAPAAPSGRPPRRRGAGPAAFSVVILAVLLTVPVLQGTADSSRQNAIAAGFARLDPPPPHVLTLVANSDDEEDDEEGEDEDDDNSSDDDTDDDGNDEGGRAGQAADEEFPGREDAALPALSDFQDIAEVNTVLRQPRASSQGSTGSFVSQCGPPDPALRNSDNWIVSPGKPNGAQHVHDYVGNVQTDFTTSAGDLLRSDTNCAFGDRSTYYFPVLRDTTKVGPDENEDGGGLDGNVGEILEPAQVVMQFLGNPTGPVSPMPQLLRVITGDAKAVTNGPDNVHAQWTCRGFEDRVTTRYPLCPEGSRLLRVLDFPSCWDGENLDSEDHRSHMAFADEETGACPPDTVAVPQLRMILAYDQPGGRTFALDSFPDQQHNPITDHGDFVNAMPDDLMEVVVECINEGRQC